MVDHQYSRSALPTGTVVHSWSSGSPRGVVVLQHGFGEYAERYVDQHARLVPSLLDAGFDVRAADLEGHGRSPGRRGLASVRRAVRDHLAVRDEAARAGVPVLLVGQALGGLIAASSAAHHPDDIAGVVLLSPALVDPVPAPLRLALGAAAAIAPGLPVRRRRRPVSHLSGRPTARQRAAADPYLLRRRPPAVLAASALDEAASLRQRLDGWTLPTLVVHGSVDTRSAPSGSSEFVAAIGSEDRTLRLISGGFHELLNDTCADEVLGEVTHWLTRHATTPVQSRCRSADRDEPREGRVTVSPAGGAGG